MSGDVRAAAAELYGLAAQLLALPVGEGGARGPSVLVTSAHTGEGKTFTTSALARYAASVGAGPILLIDADFNGPTLHRLFGCANDSGLAEAIDASVDAEIGPVESGVPNLHVLPAGASATPGLLFRRTELQRLVSKWSTLYRLVLIDGAPVAFAGSLAGLVDSVVLVVDTQRSRREVVQAALARLRLESTRVLGVVLNKRIHYIPRRLYRGL